jgi:hypothetical protein
MRINTDMTVGLLVAYALFACFPSSTTFALGGHDDTALVSESDDIAWKSLIARRIAEEEAGKKPPTHDRITWKQYWVSWYHEVRIAPGLPWKPSQFKSKDDMIRYIKNTRRAHRLPIYD